MPSGLPPLRLWRGKDCKKGTPVNPGCFCFSRECGGFACVGIVLRKRGSGIVTRLTGNARELLPAGAVQPVPCRLSKIRAALRHTETLHFSLFTLPFASPLFHAIIGGRKRRGIIMHLRRFEAGDLPAVQELFAGSIRTVCRGGLYPG